jgi:hypothetical protein
MDGSNRKNGVRGYTPPTVKVRISLQLGSLAFRDLYAKHKRECMNQRGILTARRSFSHGGSSSDTMLLRAKQKPGDSKRSSKEETARNENRPVSCDATVRGETIYSLV